MVTEMMFLTLDHQLYTILGNIMRHAPTQEVNNRPIDVHILTLYFGVECIDLYTPHSTWLVPVIQAKVWMHLDLLACEEISNV